MRDFPCRLCKAVPCNEVAVGIFRIMTATNTLVSRLQSGAEAWNNFRAANPGLEIDLRHVNLRSMELIGFDLSRVDFSHADLSGCKLERVNLTASKLIGAKLSFSKIGASRIDFCEIRKGDWYGTHCENSSFHGSDFSEASLSSVSLKDCRIDDCDFRKASTTGMVLNTRAVLQSIAYPLTDTQLSGIVFLDEVTKKKPATADSGVTVEIRISGGDISPFNLSYLLLALEGAYNNLVLLSRTDSVDLEEIKQCMAPYFQGVGASDALRITRIREGSIVIDLATAASLAGVLVALSQVVKNVGEQMISYKKLQLEAKNFEATARKVEAEADQLIVQNIRSIAELQSEKLQPETGLILSEPAVHAIGNTLPVNSAVVEQNKSSLVRLSVQPLETILWKYHRMGFSVGAQSH